MINRLISLIQRPERGWDPVPYDHSQLYAEGEWAAGTATELLDELERWVGGLEGKRVLDLGGGPGHYAVAFAQRGAMVTWYDISHRYEGIAREKAARFAVVDRMEFVIGYMDEAPRRLEPFDLVFNRICWRYGFGDRSFADVVHRLVRPGGSAYIDVTPSGAGRVGPSLKRRVQVSLNNRLGIKIGHPSPPHRRVEKLFLRYKPARLLVDYRSPNDRIWFQRATEARTDRPEST